MPGMTIKSGDIIAVSGRGVMSGLINLGTLSLPGVGASHVGIVCKDRNDPVVYESTSFGRPPCYYQKREVSGAQAHLLEDFLRFVDGSVYVYPLRRALYNHEEVRLGRTLDSSLGLPYDFLQAFQARSGLMRLLRAAYGQDNLSSLYCSEWVAHCLVQTGVFTVKNVSAWSPNKLLRTLVRAGVVDKARKLN